MGFPSSSGRIGIILLMILCIFTSHLAQIKADRPKVGKLGGRVLPSPPPAPQANRPLSFSPPPFAAASTNKNHG